MPRYLIGFAQIHAFALFIFFFALGPECLAKEGSKTIRPDCEAMTPWYDCASLEKAPALVQRGWEIVNHTSRRLGPDGNIRLPDGRPVARSTNACTNCHFGGGQVPFGLPFYQVKDKYEPPLFWRPINARRDARDSTNWCIVNCMNGEMIDKNGPTMDAIIAYVDWVNENVRDPSMKGNPGWQNLPGHSWPTFQRNVMLMRSNPVSGRSLYTKHCAGCHSKDGPGMGEYRRGEARPRIPALWGERSFTKGAAMYSVVNLAYLTRKHMPFGKPETLTEQQALDIAGYINSQPRPGGVAHTFYQGTDAATGAPNYFFKTVHWDIGVPIPGDPYAKQRLLGPWQPIQDWQDAARKAWLEGR